jgi:hypothetical protein
MSKFGISAALDLDFRIAASEDGSPVKAQMPVNAKPIHLGQLREGIPQDQTLSPRPKE